MLPMMGLTVSWVAAIRVDNVNKMNIEKDSVDRAKYPGWFAKHVLSLHEAGFLKGTKGKDAQLSTSSARECLGEELRKIGLFSLGKLLKLSASARKDVLIR